MTQFDFNSSFRNLLNDPMPPAPDPRLIAFELFRRDQLRTRVLAGLSLVFWLLGTAGIFLLTFALNRLVIDVRVESYRAAHPGMFFAPASDMQIARLTDFIHHSLPYVEASVVALMLAALFTVALIFSSRQATLNRINISLMQISEQLRAMQGPTGAQGAQPSAPAAYSIPPGLGRPATTTFLKLVMALAMLLLIGVPLLWLVARAKYSRQEAAIARYSRPDIGQWQDFPRLSPFEAVRWEDHTPHVKVAGKWYELVSMDGLPASQIVSLCKSLDPQSWQKRFEEDLVEVLTRSGYPPGTTTTLELKDPENGRIEMLRDVPMTYENRQALWRAGTTRPSN
jgi:hypothetical protein